MVKAEAASQSSGGTKRLRRQSTDQVVEKALRDNMRQWSQVQTHTMKNSEGRTLFEVVRDEIRKKRGNTTYKLGALRWREIKDMFRTPNDPGRVLDAPSPPQPVPPALLRACVSAKKQHPDRQPLQLYLSTAGDLNKTSIVGLYKLALSLNPRCQRQLPLCLDICRYMQRLGLITKHPEETTIMLSWVDSVLQARKINQL